VGTAAWGAADSEMAGTMRQFEDLEALLSDSADTLQDSQDLQGSSQSSSSAKQDSTFRADAPNFVPTSHTGVNGSSANAISLFEQIWTPGAVPDALKELWVPSEAGTTASSSPLAATPAPAAAAAAPLGLPMEPSMFRADAPTFVPQSHRDVVATTLGGGTPDAFTQLMAPRTGLPMMGLDNPLLATPPPKGFGECRNELLETPEKVPFMAPNFVVGRSRLLAARSAMGRRPVPPELKLRAAYPEPAFASDIEKYFPHLAESLEEATQTSQNPVAGALLLKLVKGEVPLPTSKEGMEQGTELLHMIKQNRDGHHVRSKHKGNGVAAYPATEVRGTNGGATAARSRDGTATRPRPGHHAVNGAGTARGAPPSSLPTAPPPSRAEIRKAAAAAREMERSTQAKAATADAVTRSSHKRQDARGGVRQDVAQFQ